MKKIILALCISTTAIAQEGIPGPFINLNDSQFVQDRMVAALLERAQRENYYDAIDGRFGGQKPDTYYIDKYYESKAKEQVQQSIGVNDEMLNNALAQEALIKDKLIAMQLMVSECKKIKSSSKKLMCFNAIK